MDFALTAQIDQMLMPLALALYVIGVFLKATPHVPDWSIPWALLALAIFGANMLMGWSIPATLQAIFACGVAVLGDQLYTQAQTGIQQTKEKHKE